MIFWDGGFKFFTGSTGCSGGIYIEDVAAHEFGHALGLNHSSVSGATMSPTTGWCSQNWRTLSADDIAGIEALYPGGEPDPDPNPNSSPTVVIATPSSSAFFAENTPISFAGTASDLQDGNLNQTMTWTSSLSGQIGTGASFSKVLSVGTHVISAAATDTGGLTGSSQILVTVNENSTPATLTAKGTKVRGKTMVTLTWSGLSASSVDLYRNGTLLKTTANDGSEVDTVTGSTGGSRGQSYVYRACAAGSSICSNDAPLVF
jgi:hypothetical protein